MHSNIMGHTVTSVQNKAMYMVIHQNKDCTQTTQPVISHRVALYFSYVFISNGS